MKEKKGETASTERVIKKYPNRRLYDTEVSRYITLEEVRHLVMENVKFRVLDKNTHEDITRSIVFSVSNWTRAIFSAPSVESCAASSQASRPLLFNAETRPI